MSSRGNPRQYGGGGGDGGYRGRGNGGGGGPPHRGGRGRAGGGGGFNAPSPGRGFDRRDAQQGGGGGGSVIFAESTPAQIPARLSDPIQRQLVASFKSLKVSPDRPLRPGYGTVGTPITLRANFFPVKVPKGPVYDYTVEIHPKTDINRLKVRIFQLLEESAQCRPHVSHIAHDRSQRLVSARKLPQPLDISFPFLEEGEQQPRPNATVYTVSVRFDRELDTGRLTQYLDGHAGARDYDPLPLISALNIVLQQHPAKNGVRVGKNRYFFPPAGRAVNLSPGVEAWQGFFTSVRPTYKQLMVNVNVCLTAFVEPGNLADALQAFSRNSKGAMATLPKPLAKSMRVTTTYLGYKKTRPLKAIGTTSARNTFFALGDDKDKKKNEKISVENYFFRQYKISLMHAADLPVVNIGTDARPNYVPAELCSIERGIPYRSKLNDKETAEMIKHACKPPRVNATAIVSEGFPKLGLAGPAAPPASAFGITISTEMAVVPARILPAPQLLYKGSPRTARNGSWNILEVKFHRGARVGAWWVLVVRDGAGLLQGPPNDGALQAIVTEFAEKCRSSGIEMPDGRPRLLVASLPAPAGDSAVRSGALSQIKRQLADTLTEKRGKKPAFILVLLERRDNFIYPGIKRIGDVELGIHTIHMQLSKVLNPYPNSSAYLSPKSDQYFSNVALKVNTKLGGINHQLLPPSMGWLTKKKTMMVGIDVTHPGPGSQDGTPSIAAVVASVDDAFVQFPASLRVQQSKKEMLDELRDMMVERLLLYERTNRVLPERILVFRDGVSEGQFDTVLQEELAQILEAFKKLETKERKGRYRPQLSIVICGKRHHARFFPTSSQFADRNGNTQPGTVVDKGITAVFGFDFYLQAHAGLQGTVKPTHYTVVYDESGLSADELQQGTHDASYLYARATKAVSLVPAAYYADLACERGRCYLNDFMVDEASSVAGGSGKGKGRGRGDVEEERKRVFEAARRRWGEGLHPDMRESMFYI